MDSNPTDVRLRALKILDALPLSDRQRELYKKGLAKIDDNKLLEITKKLEEALSKSSETLREARKLFNEIGNCQ